MKLWEAVKVREMQGYSLAKKKCGKLKERYWLKVKDDGSLKKASIFKGMLKSVFKSI